MRAYEYRHVVGFEETSLAGNVYYANYLRWQGRCREMFLSEHCPEVVEMIFGGLALITTRCSCEYLAELQAFDELIVRMRLGEIAQNRISMLFEYWRANPASAGEDLIARGEQQIACMSREGKRLSPAPIPDGLIAALRPYGAEGEPS